MELWVRSQDRTRLIKINSLEYVEYQDIHSINGYYTNEADNYDLGQYATKERALEVLDEIQKALHIPFVENAELGVFQGQLMSIVYEMPEN